MTPQNAREYIPLLEALADGELQYRPCSDVWEDIKAIDFVVPPYYYRRKPKPTVVPWDRESCPVGAVVRYKQTGNRSILSIAAFSTAYIQSVGSISYLFLLEEYTMDNGEPCGVVQK